MYTSIFHCSLHQHQHQIICMCKQTKDFQTHGPHKAKHVTWNDNRFNLCGITKNTSRWELTKYFQTLNSTCLFFLFHFISPPLWSYSWDFQYQKETQKCSFLILCLASDSQFWSHIHKTNCQLPNTVPFPDHLPNLFHHLDQFTGSQSRADCPAIRKIDFRPIWASESCTGEPLIRGTGAANTFHN